MNKEEIKHFKAMLRQGLLRHRDILLNEEFQKELLNIIKDYEKLKQENKELHERIDKTINVIHTQMKNNPIYKENLKIIENNLIKGSCKVCDLKDSDVDE